MIFDVARFPGSISLYYYLTRSRPDDKIKCINERGETSLIERATWIRECYPALVQHYWDDADALSEIVLATLAEGYQKEILEPSDHLYQIDRNLERAQAVRALVLIRDLKLDQAEDICWNYQTKHPLACSTLICRCMVAFMQKRTEDALSFLRAGFGIFTNEPLIMDWWVGINHEEGGVEGWRQAMKTACYIPGTWYPQIYAARICLQNNVPEGAFQHYEHSLKVCNDMKLALGYISTDLRELRRWQEMITLISPRYSPGEHGAETGFNLLRAYFETKDVSKGQALLREMEKIDGLQRRDRLEEFRKAFGEIANPS